MEYEFVYSIIRRSVQLYPLKASWWWHKFRFQEIISRQTGTKYTKSFIYDFWLLQRMRIVIFFFFSILVFGFNDSLYAYVCIFIHFIRPGVPSIRKWIDIIYISFYMFSTLFLLFDECSASFRCCRGDRTIQWHIEYRRLMAISII